MPGGFVERITVRYGKQFHLHDEDRVLGATHTDLVPVKNGDAVTFDEGVELIIFRAGWNGRR